MAFPDNCNLYPLKGEKLNDSSLVVLAQYSEPFASDTVEARLMIVNQQGALTHEAAILVEYFLKGDLVIDSQQILLFYSDSTRVLQLNVYDENLNLLHAHTNTDIDLACLFAEDTRLNAEILSNVNIFIMCDNPYNKADNVQLFTFSEDLSLLSHHTYTIPFGANYIESADGEIVLVSEFRDGEDSSDIRLSYFTLTGDFLESRTITLPENQAPNQILELNTGDIAIVGSENCCNKSINVGPGVSFLYLECGTTTIEKTTDKTHAVSIYPNPVTDFIHVRWNDDDSSFEKPELTIYSSSGQRLEQIILLNNISIPVNHLLAGMYYLVIIDNGNIVKRERMVKLF